MYGAKIYMSGKHHKYYKYNKFYRNPRGDPILFVDLTWNDPGIKSPFTLCACVYVNNNVCIFVCFRICILVYQLFGCSGITKLGGHMPTQISLVQRCLLTNAITNKKRVHTLEVSHFHCKSTTDIETSILNEVRIYAIKSSETRDE